MIFAQKYLKEQTHTLQDWATAQGQMFLDSNSIPITFILGIFRQAI